MAREGESGVDAEGSADELPCSVASSGSLEFTAKTGNANETVEPEQGGGDVEKPSISASANQTIATSWRDRERGVWVLSSIAAMMAFRAINLTANRDQFR